MSGTKFLGVAKTKPRYHLSKLDGDLVGLDDGKESVSGEVYAVTPEKLKQLDKYEYNIYTRRPVELTTGRKAQAYFLK